MAVPKKRVKKNKKRLSKLSVNFSIRNKYMWIKKCPNLLGEICYKTCKSTCRTK